MIELWRFGEHRLAAMLMVVTCLLYQNLNLCWSLNNEGLALLRVKDGVVSDPFGALSNWKDDVGVIDPCSWFGVECSCGNVVVLNLKDLCLGGTLAPDIGDLVHIKSITLRNNSFSGIIPEEIVELEELEVLDLGHNNFSGSFPSDLRNNLSLVILLLDNNELIGNTSPEILELKMLSEVQVDENRLSDTVQRSSCNKISISWNIAQTGDFSSRRLLQAASAEAKIPSVSPSPSPSPLPSSGAPSSFPSPFPALVPAPTPEGAKSGSSSSSSLVLILSGAIGGSLLLLILVIVIYLWQGSNTAAVKPRTTGLSGQLQKAFVTGVPNLKRSELETACEDFSNVIGSSSIGTVYKGTLSSGVEIAVISVTVICSLDWSKNLEVQFRNKIDTLSKVNHKNFVSLIGYCEEEEPFTRMMVFEYAPNGTLFEHLHIQEAEHLNWGMRMRIAMGVAYCLEHMHQLTPPVAHKNLNSTAVNLSEDYAAKITDFGFWNEVAVAEMESHPESNVYSFGVILFEMMTGRLPYSVDSSLLDDWASDYLRGDQPLREMVDPTLKSFQVEQLEKIGEVIKSCVNPDPKRRPAMREVTAKLREITEIGPDGAIPKCSPLWWAEVEIMSTEGSL